MPRNSGILSYFLTNERNHYINHLCQIDNIVIRDIDGVNKTNVWNLVGILGCVLYNHTNANYAIKIWGIGTTIILTPKNGNDLDFVCTRIIGYH